jgi:hypothetical protein
MSEHWHDQVGPLTLVPSFLRQSSAGASSFISMLAPLTNRESPPESLLHAVLASSLSALVKTASSHIVRLLLSGINFPF